MLRIDFGQTFLDHRSILVLVKKLGSINEDEFSQLFDDISQLRTVELPNSRTVHLRYTRHISHQFVDWGSFHTHKKLLGILSIARCSPEKDLATIKEAHEKLKTWYSNTSLDSRCFLLGREKPEDEDRRELSEFVFLNTDNYMEEIEHQVADYAMSLFLILESKRMDKSLEKPDKVTLLRSPLDGDTLVDNDSRNRKQCIGRVKKYMGDLCLVAGLPQEAVFHYSVAIDLLRSIGDTLWLCGSIEGLCAASLLCRTENKGRFLERPSLQLNVNQLSTAGPLNGVGNDAEESRLGSAIPLTDEEIIDKSDDIFQVYERHKDSKVLGVEARFKYARFFISKKRYKEASNALQDVLTTELALSDAEKIQQFSAMSIMYEDIGFKRKAAFFTRMAALHCTSQHLPLQGWTASYNLLRNALEGYKIYFDKNVEEGTVDGWPDLQIKILRELIKMSEALQKSDIPIRHISYLLHVMYRHMKENDILELVSSLENLAAHQKNCSLIDDLILQNGDKLPPVSLTELPVVRGMKVNVLASHLRPFVNPMSPKKTPFIFSTLNKNPGKSRKGNPVVKWVEGDVGEVAMQVFNPMPFDMKVSKMTLLTEGVSFEAFPSCLALSNDGMSHPFMLLGIPKGPGQLRITGYSVEVFGIQSNCPITETVLDNPLDLPLIVNVTPRLPLVQFKCSVPDVKSSINSSHRGSSLFLEVTLYKGQSISGPIIVENVGKIPVKDITITVLMTFKSELNNIVKLVQNHLMNALPLEAGTNSHFDLGFHGIIHASHVDGSLKSSGKIKVSYSGGSASEEGISRQAGIDVRIEVLCSLQCSNYEIKPLEQRNGHHFELSMNVKNQTSRDVEWRYEVDKETVGQSDGPSMLSAGETTRAAVILEKLDLSKIGSKESECERCTKELLELVKLQWRIPDLGVSGIIDMDGLQFNQEMVNVVRKERFTFEMMLNGVSIEKGEQITIKAASSVLLTVKACNSSDSEVSSSILSIEPFQVAQDGSQVFEVKSKICWTGSTSTLLPEVKVGGIAEHTCGFVFLCPGQYFINVRCFEKANVDLEQSFRGRTQVIKGEFLGNRRSRSSRTESFTDSLLLRERSYSSPLAKFAYAAIINVVEDPSAEQRGAPSNTEGKHSSLRNESSRGNGGELGHPEVMETCEDTNEDEVSKIVTSSEGKQLSSTIERNEERVNEMLNETVSGGIEARDPNLLGEQVMTSVIKSMESGATATTETDIIVEEKERDVASNGEDSTESVSKETNEQGDEKTKERSYEPINKPTRQVIPQQTYKEINEQTHPTSMDANPNGNDEEKIRSPSVQERIMFFNSN